MGRIIRRTVTITISESWTIVWTEDVRADDKPQPQATTTMQNQPKPQEKADETILPTVTTDAATAAQPPDMSPSQVQAVNANAPVVVVLPSNQRST